MGAGSSGHVVTDVPLAPGAAFVTAELGVLALARVA